MRVSRDSSVRSRLYSGPFAGWKRFDPLGVIAHGGSPACPTSRRPVRVTASLSLVRRAAQVDGAEAACEILHRGFCNRHVGETAMNRESSRSHAVFTLVIKATEVVEEEGLTRSRAARFNLVDLAGSERQKDTQVCGTPQRRMAAERGRRPRSSRWSSPSSPRQRGRRLVIDGGRERVGGFVRGVGELRPG